MPRASRSEVAGLHGEAIKLRIAAPPVDGAANEEIVRLIATILGVPRDRVTIERGSAGRRKLVAIQGVDPTAVAERLGLSTPGEGTAIRGR